MAGVDIEELLWDEDNEAHIARHGVTPAEVEEVVRSPATRWEHDDKHRPGRLVAYGATAAGRHLVAVCDTPSASALSYVVTARPMKPREKQAFKERVDKP
jgi:uncharacterized DUF497 family protein